MSGKTAIAIRWTEYERGWGSRPDGFTVHRNEAEANRYVDEYWAKEKARNPSGSVPDEYSKPENGRTRIPVSDALASTLDNDDMAWGHYSSHNFTHALDWKQK